MDVWSCVWMHISIFHLIWKDFLNWKGCDQPVMTLSCIVYFDALMGLMWVGVGTGCGWHVLFQLEPNLFINRIENANSNPSQKGSTWTLISWVWQTIGLSGQVKFWLYWQVKEQDWTKPKSNSIANWARNVNLSPKKKRVNLNPELSAQVSQESPAVTIGITQSEVRLNNYRLQQYSGLNTLCILGHRYPYIDFGLRKPISLQKQC